MSRTLYLGSDPSNFSGEGEVVHCPLIAIVPRDPRSPQSLEAYSHLPEATHLLFTSKNCVRIFFDQCETLALSRESLLEKRSIVVGPSTALALNERGGRVDYIAEKECQEGVIALLDSLDLDPQIDSQTHFSSHFFYPHSALSRPKLLAFLVARGMAHTAFTLYDTLPQRPDPLPKLEEFDQIVFTSPSTVHAFMQFFPRLPEGKRIWVQGSITADALRNYPSAQQEEVYYV